MADSVSVGVVGLNYWGPNLARNFDRLERARLTWCCDLDADLLDRHRPAFSSARFTTELDDLLGDPDLDAVVIATPVPTHAALAQKVLEADKHVFVEKPLALTAADARAVAELGAQRDRVVMVDHLLVHHPAVQAVKDLVEGEPSATSSTCTATGRTWASSGQTRTRSGAWGRTTSR